MKLSPMQLFTADKPLHWGTLDLPILGISKDWYGVHLNPPAGFSLATDGVSLWFVATRQAPSAVHPEAAPGSFIPELWKYDVAELFIATTDETGYLEFNLSPNGAWWACRFDGIRKPAKIQPDFAGFVVAHHDDMVPDSWLAALEIPMEPLREQAGSSPSSKANVTFILNSPKQTFHTASELPGSEPDFHQPQSFLQLIPTSLSS